jgi:hypothetical protein
MWYSVGKNCLGSVIIVLSGMLLISAFCGLFGRVGNRTFNGLELATRDLKSLFVRSLHEWMLAFGCVQASSLLDFVEQLYFSCNL